MAKFYYKAKRGPDDFVEGEMAAETQEEVVSKLESLSLIPIRVQDHKPTEKPKAVAVESSREPKSTIRVKSKDVDTFTWQLSSLVKSNVPMLRALTLVAKQTQDHNFRIVVADLQKQVKNGKMLSDAMRKYPAIFNNLYVSMIQSGEKGGVLGQVFEKLAGYREKERALKSKVQSAMAYPIIMILVGVVTIFVMLTFFMPKLIKIFANMKQTLPLPTRILIGMSHFMSEHWLWFVIGFTLVLAIFGRVKPGSKKKLAFDLIKLHMPVVKNFVKNAEIAKFSRTLGLLIKNGLPVYEALALATNTLDNDALREPLKGVCNEIVNQGSTLSSSLSKVGVFPSFAVNMIAVGEEGGRLEESLTEVAAAYEREVEQGINLMTSLIEPILILVIGGIVGFIVFAMLLPIFDIGMSGG